ncbi:MAG: hypothetical protein H6744_17945 [Deltaproteobacteria bacterium]|nr:hypothetical protein [Deltaproteobacteria bacterium]
MDPDRRDLLLRRINAKGLEVATKLSELLAGKDVRLDDFELTGDEDPRVAKEERLRAYLALVNRARARVLDGTIGTCVSCGTALSAAAVDETPWLLRCDGCEEQARAEAS